MGIDVSAGRAAVSGSEAENPDEVPAVETERDAVLENCGDDQDERSDSVAADVDAVDTESAGNSQGVEDSSLEGTSSFRWHALLAVLIVIVIGALTTYLGVQYYQDRKVAQSRELLLQTARQGAINLTTIDYTQADADVQRIVDSATGAFHDDFAQRAKPFLDVVKQVKSKSTGTVTEAAIESYSGNEAQVLLAVSVTTSTAGGPPTEARNWRMRVSVEKGDDGAKVSNVVFVP